MNSSSAFHGGKSFEAIGENFDALELHREVVSADVLDAWFDPSPRVTEKLARFLPFLLRASPPAQGCGLRQAIAQARGVPEECVLTGGGSSDLIFTCLPRLIDGGGRALLLDPMYGEYRHVLERVAGADVELFELSKCEQFRVDAERLTARVRAREPGLIALVNPNSPTGQHWPREQLLRFLDTVPTPVWVVVDETYIEYAGAGQSVEDQAAIRPNLIVIKSMSKVYALSGVRAGYLIAAPQVVERLARWMPPWAVSLPAQVAAVEALKDPAYYGRRYAETHLLREQLAARLRTIDGFTVYPSVANFLLIETESSAQEIADRARESNVYVRNCDSMSDRFQDRFLRIAVKDQAANRGIAAALSATAK